MLKLIVFKTEKFFPENNVKTFCLCFVQKFSFPERSWHMLDMFYCGKSTWMCLRIFLFSIYSCSYYSLCSTLHCEPPMTDRLSVPSLLYSCASPGFPQGHILVRARHGEQAGEERGHILSWAAPCLDPALLAHCDQLGCQDSRLIIGFCVHSGGSLGSLVSGVESSLSPLIRNNDHVQLTPPPPPPSQHKPVTC